jgi:hypothetical protein
MTDKELENLIYSNIAVGILACRGDLSGTLNEQVERIATENHEMRSLLNNYFDEMVGSYNGQFSPFLAAYEDSIERLRQELS